jgi:hypothetical protein
MDVQLLLVCYCLLKQENISISNLTVFSSSINQYELICAQKIITNESIKDLAVFTECIEYYISPDDFTATENITAVASTISNLGTKLTLSTFATTLQYFDNPPFEITFFIFFLISFYVLTGFISVIGKY